MDQRAINAYQKNAIMTASKAELTLMLYDGAIKFCNIALSGFEIANIRFGKILREFMIIFTAA